MPIVLAIKKYGKTHFSIHLLEEISEGLHQHAVDAKEVEWGLKLNSLSPFGYNLKLGNSTGIISEETKRKIAKSNTGKKASNETKQRLSLSHMGHKLKEETKKKLSNYWKGTQLSPLARQRSVESNQKTYILISPLGVETHITNMAKFCRENGYGKSNMCDLVRGHIPSYRGWTIKQ